METERYRADWIPAYAGMTGAPGINGDGARCAPSWRYRADWIPAYAGMTVELCKDSLRERLGPEAPLAHFARA